MSQWQWSLHSIFDDWKITMQLNISLVGKYKMYTLHSRTVSLSIYQNSIYSCVNWNNNSIGRIYREEQVSGTADHYYHMKNRWKSFISSNWAIPSRSTVAMVLMHCIKISAVTVCHNLYISTGICNTQTHITRVYLLIHNPSNSGINTQGEIMI